MGFIKKHRFEILFFLATVLLFFVSRLTNIMNLPIFTDEAIYVRWAQIAKNDAAWRFISLTDGKQPSYVWCAMILMRFFEDPLLAGRLVSVFAGFGSVIGLFFLGKAVFKKIWVGLTCSLLYVIFPFALVYDRMALYDSLVSFFAVWSFYFQYQLVKKPMLSTALLLGMVMGGGVLTKSSGFLSIYLFPFSIILLEFKKNEKLKTILRWISLGGIAILLAYVYYMILRLSPFYHIIDEKTATFVYPFREWLNQPFEFFLGNLLVGQSDWLVTYMTPPLLVAVVISFLIERKFFKEKLLLVTWFIVPFILLALFGKILYPRFIFFMTIFLLPLVALTLYKLFQVIKNKYLLIALFALVFFLQLKADYFIIFNFPHAPLPVSDVNQYSNDWPSGKGVNESIEYFKNVSKDKKIFIATQGTFGLLPAAYELYFQENKNIELKGYWPIGESIPEEVLWKAKQMLTYFVFHEQCTLCPEKGIAPRSWPLELVLKIDKHVENSYFTVYRVLPK